MDYSIFWTRRTSEDIASIFRFYSTIAGERVARHRLLRIKQDLLCLTTMPHIGHLDKDYPHTPSYRYLVVLDYRIYYFIEEQTVYIAAIWDCRQGSPVFEVNN